MPIKYGNGIKDPNCESTLTSEGIEEIQKCYNTDGGFRYFFSKYIYYPSLVQSYVIDVLENNRFCILENYKYDIDVISASVLFNAFKFSYHESAVVCFNNARSLLLAKTVKNMYESLPNFIKTGVEVYDSKTIRFIDGNRIYFTDVSPDALRGYGINELIIDDVSLMKEKVLEEFLTSTIPVIPHSPKNFIKIISSNNYNNNILKNIKKFDIGNNYAN